jgi:hypothetical protein
VPSRACRTPFRATALVLGVVVAGTLAAGAARAAAPALDAFFPYARDGLIVFAVEAPENATVALIGDFNDWDDTATPMRHVGDGVFEAAVALDPGDYAYKYVIDGRRILDRSNPEEIEAADGTIRSRITVLRNGRVSERSLWWSQPARKATESWVNTFGHRGFHVGGYLSFNRVDGTTLWLKPSYRGTADLAPEITTSFGYGWESEHFTIEADIAQPILPERVVFLGVRLVDGTAYDNQSEVGIGENTLAALFFKHDFIDYYDVRGVEPYVRLHLPHHTTLRLSFADEDYKSLTTQTQWSVFEAGRDTYRPNPHLFLLGEPDGLGGEGTLHATRVDLTYDTRRARHAGTVGFFARSFFEFGHGDFDYGRWIGDGRAYLRPGRPFHLALRLRGGGRFDGGAIPSQKLFWIGGLGTVRGHEFRSRYGDREMLGNLEYTFLFDRSNYGALVFYDAGTVWNSNDSRLADSDVMQSVGVGFKTSNDDFQINFAKPVGSASAAGIETTVRLNRTF